MPPRIPRACRKHGCRHTTIDRSGYCPEHINTGWENHQQGKTRQERGYGANWDKLRPLILARDKHLCQEHKRQGKPVPATTVDHILAVPPKENWARPARMISILIYWGGAGKKFRAQALPNRRLSFCYAPAGWKPFSWGSPIAINRSFLSCLDHREPQRICV